MCLIGPLSFRESEQMEEGKLISRISPPILIEPITKSRMLEIPSPALEYDLKPPSSLQNS